MKIPLNFRVKGRDRPGISAPTTAWVGHVSPPTLAPSSPLYIADALSYKKAVRSVVSGRSLHRQSLKHFLSWCNAAKILPFTEAPFYLYILTFPSLIFSGDCSREKAALSIKGSASGQRGFSSPVLPPSLFPASSQSSLEHHFICCRGCPNSLTPPMSFPYHSFSSLFIEFRYQSYKHSHSGIETLRSNHIKYKVNEYDGTNA